MSPYFKNVVWISAVLAIGTLVANIVRDVRRPDAPAVIAEVIVALLVAAVVLFIVRQARSTGPSNAVRGEVAILALFFCVVLAGAVRVVFFPLR